MEKGLDLIETGSEAYGNKFAPPVRNVCSGRGKILWRTCESFAAAAKNITAFLSNTLDCSSQFCLSICKDTKKTVKMQVFRPFFLPSL